MKTHSALLTSDQFQGKRETRSEGEECRSWHCLRPMDGKAAKWQNSREKYLEKLPEDKPKGNKILRASRVQIVNSVLE